MDYDDVIYSALLFFSIGSGHFYRKIEDPEQKKLVGSLIGLGITLVVSGFHILHPIILTFVNVLIILLFHKKTCHLVSFTFSFLYLLFFRTTIYFGIPYAPAHTNLIIMILTLKLVGVTFELNTTYMREKQDKKEATEEEFSRNELTEINPTALDIIHYAFNYAGLLAGPYYSYRTYWDSLYMPYSKYAKCQTATWETFKYVPVYAVLFLWATYTWPLSYALTDLFYEDISWLYRLWYVVPLFCIFRLRIYIGILLSVCVCTMAGVGAYPKFTEPKSGQGPSTKFSALKNVAKNDTQLSKEEYDFGAVENIRPYDVEFCTTFREAMKHWNITVQYWMAVNIYKRFPSKQFRTLVTLFVSSFWHGVYIGHYFCIGGAPFYLSVEDLYYKLILKDNKGKWVKIWEWAFWACKMYAFSYLGMAFYLLTASKVMRFYNSVYHFGPVVLTSSYVIGVMIAKSRPRKVEKAQ